MAETIDVEGRLQEIEDLLLLIQLENTKIKEKFSLDIAEKTAQLPSGIEDRLSKIEASVSQQDAALPKNISAMLGAMKARVQEIDDVKAEMEKLETTKIPSDRGFERYLDKISRAKLEFNKEFERLMSLKDELEEFSKERESIAHLVSEAEVNVEKTDTFFTKLKTLEEKIRADVERMESAKNSIDSKLRIGLEKLPSERVIEQYLDRLSRTKQEIEREFNQLKSLRDELEEVTRDKESLIQRISESEINVEKTNTMVSKLKTLEEKIYADVERMESVKDGIDAKFRVGLEKIEALRKDVEGKISASEDKTKSRIEKIDSVKESLDIKIGLIEEKISEAEMFSRDIENIKKMLSSHSSVSGEFESIKKRMDNLALLKESVEEEATMRISLEKRLQDMGKRLKAMEGLRSSVDEETIDIISIDKKLQDMGNEISTLKKGGIVSKVGVDIEKELLKEKEMLLAKISEIKASVEKESKAVGEGDIKKLHSEVAEQKKVIDNMEKRLEAAAVKFFTENLEEFSKAIDRKLPELVRKEDYEKDIREIVRKMQLMETPDLTPLSSRVYMLEKKIDDIYTLMRSVATRLPVVVE